mmetsp:Transcript_20072/g.25656  ORF Transcript_20072/g.25656 Transcript_20072/m.25656 type:complete len:227 (+) Transcript_20072:93-773(+)
MDTFVNSAIFGAGATLGGRAMNSAIDETKNSLKNKPKPPPPRPLPAPPPQEQQQLMQPVEALPVYAQPITGPSYTPYPLEKRPVPVPPVPVLVQSSSVSAKVDDGPTRQEFQNMMNRMEAMALTIKALQSQVDQLRSLLETERQHKHEQQNRTNSDPTPACIYTHIARFAYDKRNQDELTISKGEKLVLVDEGRDSGWVIVRNEKGLRGLVPLNFIEPKEQILYSN